MFLEIVLLLGACEFQPRNMPPDFLADTRGFPEPAATDAAVAVIGFRDARWVFLVPPGDVDTGANVAASDARKNVVEYDHLGWAPFVFFSSYSFPMPEYPVAFSYGGIGLASLEYDFPRTAVRYIRMRVPQSRVRYFDRTVAHPACDYYVQGNLTRYRYSGRWFTYLFGPLGNVFTFFGAPSSTRNLEIRIDLTLLDRAHEPVHTAVYEKSFGPFVKSFWYETGLERLHGRAAADFACWLTGTFIPEGVAAHRKEGR